MNALKAVGCIELASIIVLPVPNPKPSVSRSSGDLQRKIDQAQLASHTLDKRKAGKLTAALNEGSLTLDVTEAMNDCLSAQSSSLPEVTSDSPKKFLLDNGVSTKVPPPFFRGVPCRAHGATGGSGYLSSNTQSSQGMS